MSANPHYKYVSMMIFPDLFVSFLFPISDYDGHLKAFGLSRIDLISWKVREKMRVRRAVFVIDNTTIRVVFHCLRKGGKHIDI